MNDADSNDNNGDDQELAKAELVAQHETAMHELQTRHDKAVTALHEMEEAREKQPTSQAELVAQIALKWQQAEKELKDERASHSQELQKTTEDHAQSIQLVDQELKNQTENYKAEVSRLSGRFVDIQGDRAKEIVELKKIVELLEKEILHWEFVSENSQICPMKTAKTVEDTTAMLTTQCRKLKQELANEQEIVKEWRKKAEDHAQSLDLSTTQRRKMEQELANEVEDANEWRKKAEDHAQTLSQSQLIITAKTDEMKLLSTSIETLKEVWAKADAEQMRQLEVSRLARIVALCRHDFVYR